MGKTSGRSTDPGHRTSCTCDSLRVRSSWRNVAYDGEYQQQQTNYDNMFTRIVYKLYMILCSINLFQSGSFITATLHIPLHSPLGCSLSCWWWWNLFFTNIYLRTSIRLLGVSRWRRRWIRIYFYSNASCTLHVHMLCIMDLKTFEEYSTGNPWPFDLPQKTNSGKLHLQTWPPQCVGKINLLDPYTHPKPHLLHSTESSTQTLRLGRSTVRTPILQHVTAARASSYVTRTRPPTTSNYVSAPPPVRELSCSQDLRWSL